MLADGLRIAQIGVLLKQAFEQGFFWRAPDLTHFQGPQFGKVDLQRRFVYPDQRRRPASGLRVICVLSATLRNPGRGGLSRAAADPRPGSRVARGPMVARRQPAAATLGSLPFGTLEVVTLPG